jgi:predicted amidohydrolase YtcJ
VGSEAEVRAWAGDAARVVELRGRALLPGFVDAHGHFPGTGVFARVADLNSPPIGDVRTLDDLVECLREQERSRGSGWVLGMGYDDSLLAEGRHPTRADLDRVSSERPVAAIHISGHLAALNGRGLEQLGIGAATPDPPGGVIRRDAAGEPTGVLEEMAMEPLRVAMRPGLLDALAIVREGSRRYLAAGVTTAQVGYATRELLGLVHLVRFGLLPLRLVVWPDLELADEVLAGRRRLESPDESWLRFGAVKLIADGSIQGYTAWLTSPYHVAPGGDSSFRGYPRMAPEELAERVSRYHAAGLQVAVHGNGDAAIDAVLGALERAARETPRADARPVVIHAQMTRPDQLDRMAALGAIPSFFGLHVYYWGDRHRDLFLGPERAARISPAASARARGLRFTLHCDTPVIPIEPLRAVATAVARRTRSGAELGPEERVSAQAALRAVTIDAAFQHFQEASRGSLEPGKLADLVILSRSPLEDPEHADAIRVEETIVGGRSAWKAEP